MTGPAPEVEKGGVDKRGAGHGKPPGLFDTVFSRPSLSRCVPIALAVGTLLSLVNQGSVIFDGAATTATWIRVLVNYLIPFCVSSAGFYSSQRTLRR